MGQASLPNPVARGRGKGRGVGGRIPPAPTTNARLGGGRGCPGGGGRQQAETDREDRPQGRSLLQVVVSGTFLAAFQG